jgi:uncharacterized tellurite resistance protein B-like protein
MLQSINRFFENYLKPSESAAEDSSKQADRLQLASAALMIELCRADQHFDEEEILKISSILRSRFDLSQDTLDELYELALQEAEEATSLYQFTSLINEAYDYEAKTALIHNLWEVAYVDGNLERYEEHLIRRVAELLYVSHSDFIKTKLQVKND